MKMNTWLRVIAATLFFAGWPLFGQSDESSVTDDMNSDSSTVLTIVHSSDGESALLSDDYSGSVAQFATVVESIVDDVGRENVLIVSSGDNFLAGLEYAVSEGVYDARALSQIGFDVSAIGNHEFDFGPQGLEKFIVHSNFVFVSSNLDFSQEVLLRRFDGIKIFDHHIVEKAGQKIGIVGATTEQISYISSPGQNIKINPVQDSLQEAVDHLRDQGINIIVALTHLQNIEEEKQLAQQLDGVDIFVAGGGDDLIGNENNSYLVRQNRAGDYVADTPTGPYPFRTSSISGEPVVVVSTDGSYNYVGRLDVQFDKDGVITAVSDVSGPVPVLPDVEPDRLVQSEIVSVVNDEIGKFAEEIIGTTENGLNGTREIVRTQESTMGNAITDGYLYTINAYNLGGADFAFTNGGGIRRSVVVQPDSDINRQQVLTALPFSNYLTIVQDMSASEIKDLFEHSVGVLPEAGGRFLQISGVSVTYDSRLPAGSRVKSIMIGDDVIVSDGEVVSTDTYDAVTNSFLAGGGDGYEVLGNIAKERKVGAGYSYAQGFEVYIRDQSPIVSPISGRLNDLAQ